MRCVFSESLNRQTLGLGANGPPGKAVLDRVRGDRAFAETSWRAVVRVLRSPAHGVVELFHDVVTTVFPANCRCCDGPLLRAGSIAVCDACVGHVDRIAGAARAALGCWRCGEAMELEIDLEDLRFSGQMAAKMRCRACRMAEPEFDRAAAFGDYDGELRKLIHLLKFDRVAGLAETLGDRLAKAVLQLEDLAGRELLVVAVPLFDARRRERGYNQSVLLADCALARLAKLRPDWRLTEVHGLMRRVRRTESQYTLSQRERRLNLRGAFKVVDDVSGREVLLIDDIMTSGATARECARVLKAAGAAKVWVATVARAQRREMARIDEGPDDAVAIWDAA